MHIFSSVIMQILPCLWLWVSFGSSYLASSPKMIFWRVLAAMFRIHFSLLCRYGKAVTAPSISHDYYGHLHAPRKYSTSSFLLLACVLVIESQALHKLSKGSLYSWVISSLCKTGSWPWDNRCVPGYLTKGTDPSLDWAFHNTGGLMESV